MTDKRFTYSWYRWLIRELAKKGYTFAHYCNCEQSEKCVIMRHDVDNDIKKALDLAEIENDEGVSSVYFILTTSDFYNVNSLESRKQILRIIDLGHRIGLHFDETAYGGKIDNCEEMSQRIIKECNFLSSMLDYKVNEVSMHRPSKMILESDISIPGIYNSYSKKYFEDFKYVSDSRRNWKEPVEEYVIEQKYNKLHILTHPFWYFDEELSMHDTIKRFVMSANIDRYNSMSDNFTNLPDVLNIEELKGGMHS